MICEGAGLQSGPKSDNILSVQWREGIKWADRRGSWEHLRESLEGLRGSWASNALERASEAAIAYSVKGFILGWNDPWERQMELGGPQEAKAD